MLPWLESEVIGGNSEGHFTPKKSVRDFKDFEIFPRFSRFLKDF